MILLQRQIEAMPSGNKKQEDSFRQQRETWRRAYAEAHSVRERFPEVEQLVLDMAFTDLKGIGRYSPQMRSFSASAKAFFAIACPRTLCLDGGFDLDSTILAMLASDRIMSIGTLECRGWVDPARPENARCLLQMRYQLQARYVAPKASGSGQSTRV
jgi:hypothetical protein